jgi:hypothetical protein
MIVPEGVVPVKALERVTIAFWRRLPPAVSTVMVLELAFGFAGALVDGVDGVFPLHAKSAVRKRA